MRQNPNYISIKNMFLTISFNYWETLGNDTNIQAMKVHGNVKILNDWGWRTRIIHEKWLHKKSQSCLFLHYFTEYDSLNLSMCWSGLVLNKLEANSSILERTCDFVWIISNIFFLKDTNLSLKNFMYLNEWLEKRVTSTPENFNDVEILSEPLILHSNFIHILIKHKS